MDNRQPSSSQTDEERLMKSRSAWQEKKYTGVVKWYNVSRGMGYIKRDDTNTDIYVNQNDITGKNPQKVTPSLLEGEPVEFNIMVYAYHRLRAINVTGPNGAPVKGSPYTSNKNYYHTSTTVQHMGE